MSSLKRLSLSPNEWDIHILEYELIEFRTQASREVNNYVKDGEKECGKS